MITILAANESKPIHRISTSELSDWLAEKSAEQVIWVDLLEPTREEEDLILRDQFRFHPLAIRDCRYELDPAHKNADHHPKVEDYGEYLFSIINPVDLDRLQNGADGARVDVETRQINVFLGKCYVVMHHYEKSAAIDSALETCEKNPQLFNRGPDYIYHLVLDGVVDQYSPLLDKFDDEVERLELEVFHRYNAQLLSHILEMKRSVYRMRRITTYQREMVYRLSRGEFELVTQDEIAYYRNVYDHLVRAADLTESYRDILAGLLEAYLSVASNRLNEIVKMLTILSTFFLPLTFIAGVYGMNFQFMPELHWRLGYPFALGVMAATAATMFVIFRRRKWL